MVGSDEALSKKRRLDESTHNAIRETTGHLQYLGGNRQNRWMMDVGSTPGIEHTANAHSNLAAHAERARLPQKPAVVATDLDEEAEGEEEARLAQKSNVAGVPSPSHPRGTPQYATHLVSYEAPEASAVPGPRITNMSVDGRRKSMEAALSAQPSLPSPAPSDENTNSPTFAEIHFTSLRNRGGQRVSTDIGMTAISGPGSPMHMRSPVQLQQPHQRYQQQHHLRTISTPQSMPVSQAGLSPQFHLPLHNGQNLPQAPRQVQPQLHLQHPRRGQAQGRPTQANVQQSQFNGPILPSNAQLLQPPPPVPSGQGRPLQQGLLHQSSFQASRIPKQLLLNRITAVEQTMQSKLRPNDHGRLALLCYAVQKDDWFYQVLSQLFCMRSVMPNLLPKSLKDLSVSTWEQLGGLLVPNTEVNNELLMFFSEFPEPIMDLYSDPHNAREIYEGRVQIVKVFLLALPQHWEGLTHRCREMLAPPLVEDMETILHLHSEVLQTTCFRAIARMFWGVEESAGMNTLEGLHEMDQQTCIQHRWRRNPTEKLQAYAALRDVYDHWEAYKKLQQQRTPLSPPLQPFTVPQEINLLFRTVPRSMMSHIPQQMHNIQTLPSQRRDHWQPLSLAQQVQHIQQNQRALQPSHVGGHSQSRGNFLQPANVLSPGGPHMHPPSSARSGQIAAQLSPQPVQNVLPGQPLAKKRLAFPILAEVPRPQPTHPEPGRSGLHQAHLRSPNLVPVELKQDAPKLYRYVTGFAMLPVIIKKRMPVQVANFQLLDDVFDKVAKTIPATTGSGLPHTRIIGEDSLMYRLRCCAVPATGFASESSWVVADNSWPEELSFELNGVQLHTRRKLHHGRYLPVDVTSHVVRGVNKLRIFLNRSPHDTRKFDYALAIETIGVMSHESVKNSLSRVSAQDSLAAIKKALLGQSGNDDDDDIAVISSNMTISIVEPLSQARLVDVPVRGANCLHKDVFDLEVFLSACKRERPDWPTVVDCWRCPLCRGDIRPQTLVLDEFLLDVRVKLEKTKLMDTKAIVVETDGSWRPKKEERTGVCSPSLEREEGGCNTSASTPAAPTSVVEIIELE